MGKGLEAVVEGRAAREEAGHDAGEVDGPFRGVFTDVVRVVDFVFVGRYAGLGQGLDDLVFVHAFEVLRALELVRAHVDSTVLHVGVECVAHFGRELAAPLEALDCGQDAVGEGEGRVVELLVLGELLWGQGSVGVVFFEAGWCVLKEISM